MMLGNEPAKEEYMAEAPRKRDESIVSKKMMGHLRLVIKYMLLI